MSRPVIELAAYWITHPYPPLIDGIELLEDPSLFDQKQRTAVGWREFTTNALRFGQYLVREASVFSKSGLLRIETRGMDEFTTAKEALGMSTRDTISRMARTRGVFTAIAENRRPRENDLIVAQRVAGALLRKVLSDPLV